MINISNISVKAGGKIILNKASFTLKAGEVVIVLGKNGAGKSTLLKALTGILATDEGSILWNSKNLTEFSFKELAKMRAVLSQSISLNFPMQVRDLVEMGSYALDRAPEKQLLEKLLQDALSEVDMKAFADREFNTLSGGEQKRVLLAKCILQLSCTQKQGQDQFLFLDEPTASLDIQQQYKLAHFVKKLAKEKGLGIFAVVHDVNLASQFADRIILMRDGKIMKIGSPEEILTVKTLKEALDIDSIVQKHPVYGCPHIIPLPQGEDKQNNSKNYSVNKVF
ncbi:MAG: heme ABC transporter ATP-binding protein [Bacteroidota bacterium]